MTARSLSVAALAPLVVLASPCLAQTPVSATLVMKEGDLVAGQAISALNSPFTDGTGRMAALATLGVSARAIVDENLVVLFNSATVGSPVLTGGEGTIGFSDANGYIYSPSADGLDAVYADGGLLLRDDDDAPDLTGRFATFCSRPTMLPDGTAYWVSGTAVAQGGSNTLAVLYRNPTPSIPSATVAVLKGGDVYGGLTIANTGIEFGYSVSNNGLHRIHALTATGVPTTSDVYIAADDVIVAREGSPAPVGNWTATLRIPSINNSGQWAFAGDTSFATTTQDEVLLTSTGQFVQEGTVVGGTTLSGTCNSLSINNLGDLVFTWGTGANEVLCKGQIASLPGSLVKLLQVNDLIDVDGDDTGDYTIIDFEASAAIGPGLDLGDDGRVFVEVTIRPVGGTSADDAEAIIRLGGDTGGGACNLADISESGGTLEEPGSPDGQLTLDDILVFVDAYNDATGCPGTAPCNLADITESGGTLEEPGSPDGQLTLDDILVFVDAYNAGCA